MISFPSHQVWEHCYDSQWNGMIVKEAFMHPAKLSRGLIERIYDQMIERGWLKKADLVADCFGGVGCGGVTAAYRGLHWFGCELEERFVWLARKNFNLHKPKLEYIGCPQPQIVQGDSRRFAEIARQHCKALVTSPPYAGTLLGNEHCGIDWEKAQQNGKDGGNHSHGASVSGDYGKTEGQIGGLGSGSVDAVVGSPPYSQPHQGGGGINLNGYHPGEGRKFKSSNPDQVGARTYQGRGGDRTEGNIETLAEGEIGAVVTSPPWESNCEGGRQAAKFKDNESILKCNRGNGASDEAVLAQAERDKQKIYGESAGQIGKLSGGSVDAAITSPPYADISAGAGGLNTRPARKPGQQSGRNPDSASQTGNWSKDILRYGKTEGQISQLEKGPLDATVTSPPYGETLAHRGGPDTKQEMLDGGKSLNEIKTGYGNTEGQTDPQTYWQAMDQVYRQCFEAIKPGGFLVVVLKNYVKERKVVDLSGDSARLLAHIGFEPVLRVRAMLTRETVHSDLFEGERTETRSRKSFFRRLAEKKGSPKIDWEDVLFFNRAGH